MNLFEFYKLSFIVAALSGGALAQIGKHYFSRGNILEIFLLSQLALLGNLISRLFFHSHGANWSGVLFSYILFGLGKLFLYKKNIKSSEQGTFMVGGYLFLLSLQYLIIGFFPQLDSHMSIGFFGNMVTASKFENVLMITTVFVFIALYLWKRKSINRNTIEINVFTVKDNSKFELLLFSFPLVASLYSLGFLYTMSFLLLPPLMIGGLFLTEKKASLYLVFISAFSSILGLGLSIYFEKLSTTSMQIASLFFVLLSCFFVGPCWNFLIQMGLVKKHRAR